MLQVLVIIYYAFKSQCDAEVYTELRRSTKA